MARYGTFVRSLLNSKLLEVQFLANLVINYISSTTSKNLALIRNESGVDTLTVPPMLVRKNVKKAQIPLNQEWRIPLLEKLLIQRKQMKDELLDTKDLQKLIDSLCSS